MSLASDIANFDEDPIELAFVEAANRVKTRWEQSHDTESYLGHAAVGFWMYFWMAADQRTTMDLIAARDSSALRRSANDYIEAGFGEKRGPALDVPAEDHVPAALV